MVFAQVSNGIGEDGLPSAWHAEGDLLAEREAWHVHARP